MGVLHLRPRHARWPIALGAVGGGLARKKWLGVGMGAAAMVFGLSSAAMGVIAYGVASSRIDGALEHVEPENREMLREEGARYARQPLLLGLLCASGPLLLGGAGIGLGFARAKKGEPETA